MKAERMPLAMKKTRAALVPVSGFDDERLAEIPDGAIVEVSVSRRRSLPQLRRYWSVLHKVVAATGKYPTPEHLHAAIKLALGYATDVVSMDGEIVRIPDSAALDKMDGKQFGEFFDAAVELLNRLTGTDVLEQEAV